MAPRFKVCPDCYPIKVADCGRTDNHDPHVYVNTVTYKGKFGLPSEHHGYRKNCSGLAQVACRTCGGEGIVPNDQNA